MLRRTTSVVESNVSVAFAATALSRSRALLQASPSPLRRGLLAAAASLPATDVRIVVAAAPADAPAVASALLVSFADSSFVSALARLGLSGLRVEGIPTAPFVALPGQAAFPPASDDPPSRDDARGYDMAVGFGLALGIGVPLTFLGIVWLLHTNSPPKANSVSPAEARAMHRCNGSRMFWTLRVRAEEAWLTLFYNCQSVSMQDLKVGRWETPSGVPPGQEHFYQDLKKLFPVARRPRHFAHLLSALPQTGPPRRDSCAACCASSACRSALLPPARPRAYPLPPQRRSCRLSPLRPLPGPASHRSNASS